MYILSHTHTYIHTYTHTLDLYAQHTCAVRFACVHVDTCTVRFSDTRPQQCMQYTQNVYA